MYSPRLVQLTAAVLCAGLLFASSRLMPSINASRTEMNTTGITSEDPVKNAPPEYAFAVQALGAFRGLLTNIAFIRATELKEKGRYYDAMDLASWICTLQPHFPSVWEFQSWNMAWNISVTTFTPQERWKWVYNGVKLVRDEGLKYNPRAVNLYKQIAWIYVNKMSETTDDHHLTYKRNWAWHMHLVLGEPPRPLEDVQPSFPVQDLLLTGDDPLTRAFKKLATTQPAAARPAEEPRPEAEGAETPYEIVKKAAYLRIQEIADAPASLAALYAQTPETREMVAKLRDALGIDINDKPLSENVYWSDEPRSGALSMSFFMRYRKLTDPRSMMSEVLAHKTPDPDQPNLETFDRIVGAAEHRPAGQALLRYLQRRVLREVYKLDLSHMVEMMKLFGPMDWRMVDAHSLYWVTQSIVQGRETISQFGNDKVNTTRLLFFSLRNLYLRNKLIFEPFPQAIHASYINLTPDINFIEPMHQAFIQYGPLVFSEVRQEDLGPGAGETYKTGHINFLTESIRLLYFADRKREAAHYYEYLRNTYYKNDDGTFNEAFSKPLKDYVEESYREGLGGPRETALAINAWLDSAYAELALWRDREYNALVKQAMQLHTDYHAGYSETAVSKKLPSFAWMQADRLKFFFMRPPGSHLDTLHKARLWKHLPQNLKRAVYDELIEGFKGECEFWDFDAALAFSEPAGMDEYRKALERRGPQDEEKGFETPVQTPGG